MHPLEEHPPSLEEVKINEKGPDEERLKTVIEELKQAKEELNDIIKKNNVKLEFPPDGPISPSLAYSEEYKEFRSVYEKLMKIFHEDIKGISEIDISDVPNPGKQTLKHLKVFDKDLAVLVIWTLDDPDEMQYENHYAFPDSKDVEAALKRREEVLLSEISEVKKAKDILEGKKE